MEIERVIRDRKHPLIKFCILGGVATILNYAVFLVSLLLLDLNYLLASAAGYISGVLLMFMLHQRYTFESESRRYMLEVVKYFMVYSASLFFGLGMLKVAVSSGINVLLANVIILAFTATTNYLGTKLFVFDHTRVMKRADYLIYRYRYFLTYIIIGLGSLILEILILSLLRPTIPNVPLITIGSFILGMLFAFVLNSRLNFKVPKDKRLRTFRMFASISVFAFILNTLMIRFFLNRFVIETYSISRFISAGCIFLISYSLHRRFTFTDVKEVGIAIYLSRDEDLSRIKEKVAYRPDWIHLDLVDQSFNASAKETDVTKGNEIKSLWPNVKVMTHLMSKTPSRWVNAVVPFSDYIIIHAEIEEPILKVLNQIADAGKKSGISFLPGTPVEALKPYMDRVDIVQVLGIATPGESGHHVDARAIKALDELNRLKKGHNFALCFDGGVKLSNVDKINAKYIVSGSTVLDSDKAAEAIYALKTSSRYYYDHHKDFKRFIKKEIFAVLEDLDFVKSGTLVGSFVENEGLEGISDIDIIVIVDTLTKSNFDTIVSRLSELEQVIKTDYGYDLIINTAFGPLKFNKEKTVVFHVMIYDIERHISHCIRSPFTCLDWQRSADYVKAPMSDIHGVSALQPNYFFNSRRSVKDYLSDLSSDTLSYREYDFRHGVKEIKKAKAMDNRDWFEFSYHIMRFCMLNFLKLHRGENKRYSPEHLAEAYFGMFPLNKNEYIRHLARIREMKSSNRFGRWKKEHRNLLHSFLDDFETQFKGHFHRNATSVYFMRHEKTKMNKPGVFLGQRSDPEIITPAARQVRLLSSFLSEKGVTRIYSSPSKRCLQTVDLIKDATGIRSFVIDDNLREVDYGDVDGKDYKHLQEKYPQIIKQWGQGKDPRFPNGENTADVLGRVKAFLASLQKEVPACLVVCTHNVFLRCLVGHLYNIPQPQWHRINIPHIDLLEVILTCDGRFYLNLTEEQREEIFRDVSFGK